MIARLWWKEFRAFGRVWLVLLLVSAGLDGFLYLVNQDKDRDQNMIAANLCMALLYAFAVSSAAFSGERESNTLGFLDALPVRRWTLWLGKVTFAIGSTIGLATLLLGLGFAFIDHRSPDSPFLIRLPVFSVLLYEAMAWGLFWSSISKNPLLAGAMSVASLISTAILSSWSINAIFQEGGGEFLDLGVASIHLSMATLGLVVSGLAMTRRPSRGGRAGSLRVPVSASSSSILAPSAIRNLSWLAVREGWTTGFVVILIGLVIPIGLDLLGKSLDGSAEFLTMALAGLVAGVSVFGTDYASTGRRFLVNHGVRAGLAWTSRMMAWIAAMAAFLGLVSLKNRGMPVPSQGLSVTSIGPPEYWPVTLLATIVDAFAVGVVCGMVIRRRITATMVGAIGLVLVIPIQVGMVWGSMIPTWTLILVPLILLAISRAWAGDWLHEREGIRPWIRLGTWFAVPFGLLFGSYAAYRAWSLPDVGLQYDPAALAAKPLPAEQDAAEAYQVAIRKVASEAEFYNDLNGTTSIPLERVIESGWNPAEAGVVGFWSRNREAIRLALEASTLPQGRFENPMPADFYRGLRLLEQLLALDTRERLSRGDLPGSWADLLAQFRMSAQLESTWPNLTQRTTAAHFDTQAVALAFDWLAAPGQSPETLRRALADLRALPEVPNMVQALQVESSIIEHRLNLPANELADEFSPNDPGNRLAFTYLIAPPWERERARRACRTLIAEELRVVRHEPARRNPSLREREEIATDFRNSTLTRMIFPSIWPAVDQVDGELVGRRALIQAVALTLWKLEHQGQTPQTLDAIVGPGLLEVLPLDPYSGSPFVYDRSYGQTIPPLIGKQPRPTRAGQPMIYSVGFRQHEPKNETTKTNMKIQDFSYPIP